MWTGQPCRSCAIRRTSLSKTALDRSLPSLKMTECAVFSRVIVTSLQIWTKPLRSTSSVTASIPVCRSTTAISDLLDQLELAVRLGDHVRGDQDVSVRVDLGVHPGRDPDRRPRLLDDGRP